jgi:hypothetical protein
MIKVISTIVLIKIKRASTSIIRKRDATPTLQIEGATDVDI